jgi:hypothetical protein
MVPFAFPAGAERFCRAEPGCVLEHESFKVCVPAAESYGATKQCRSKFCPVRTGTICGPVADTKDNMAEG